MEPVPPVHGIADLTPAWCTAALAADLGGAAVTSVRTEPVGTGMVADTVRLHLAYDRRGAGPATLVAKVPAADPTSRAAATATRTYELEARFYRDLAPHLPVRTPRCYHAAHDPATPVGRKHSDAPVETYVVVMEDVAPASQGDQVAGCSVDEVAAAIDELALLHGPRWGDESLASVPWLRRPDPDGIAALVAYAIGPFEAHYGTRLDAATLDLARRVLPRYLAGGDRAAEPMTLVHGDFRAENLLFGGARVVVVDWQTVGIGQGAADLSYLLGGTLTPEDRRAAERELVARYVGRLTEQGVQVLADATWAGYRLHAFAGLTMAVVASALVGRTERGDDMFVAMAERAAVHALELDAEALLA